jgi:superfamily II DNA or RNA helicase/diadenosine tetraphosphate (Ap4A) HIT family hydrolase/HKD family nuclease
VVGSELTLTDPGCPFCDPPADQLFHRGDRVVGLWDRFPVSRGHALLIPRRHVSSWFSASDAERIELMAAVDHARAAIERIAQPDGYNLGVNIGEAGGQTVFHLHLHVIPRYHGDVPRPRGGIRHVIPGKAEYPGAAHEALRTYLLPGQPGTPRTSLLTEPPHWRALVPGGDDPLLPHLRAHLSAARALDIAVAFVLERGLVHIEPHLKDLVRRGGRLRVVTGDYLDVTEPEALLRLLDLAMLGAPDGPPVQLRVFESGGRSFHPKAYVVHLADGDGVAFVGSSNLSETALLAGIEWNYRVVPPRDRAGFRTVCDAFEALFRHPLTTPLTPAWVDQYQRRRRVIPLLPTEVLPEPLLPVQPHAVQREALDALDRTRADGNGAGLVVLATGLGKTWLAAFDSMKPAFARVLFVAHREEILGQALATFRQIRPRARLGFYTGDAKAPEADVLLASVQTLGRIRHLGQFARDAFDYIVIDEFHHAAATTYRRILDHFTPRFLLGLTATPERADGGDLLALCDENLVYRCDVPEAIRRGLLVPFHYFGVPDEVDYRNIPWRSTRFDETALTQAVATRSRAGNALEQWRERAGRRTLAFCCSTRHADFMAAFFRDAGVRAAAVHSGSSSDPRAASLEALRQGDLEIIFAVDIFNEGVDVPTVDTVMMLRPTESRVVWLQQFGRGLRQAEGKPHLTVIDYIGNHRTFLVKPQTLFGLSAGDAQVATVLDRVAAHQILDLPPGCEVTYDLRTIEILRALLRTPRDHEALRAWYEDFRERHGVRPRAIEAYHDGYQPRSVRRTHGSWLGFVHHMGDLDPATSSLIQTSPGATSAGSAARFLDELETTPMTRSYKMLVLLALLNEDQLPGSLPIVQLVETVARLTQRSARLQGDLGITLTDTDALRAHLERHPIAAWTGGAGTGGVSYFSYAAGIFATRFGVPQDRREALQELVRELVDWRLAEYLERGPVEGPATGDRIVCKVSHAGGRPILFLPDRRTHPGLPEGPVPVMARDEEYEAHFVKVAVNVLRRPGTEQNVLPALLREWFGPDAGLPGTSFSVVFEREGDRYRLSPVSARAPRESGPQPWRQYAREQIPPLFGLTFAPSRWNQGFVFDRPRAYLLVTLDKAGKAAEHHYQDRFLSSDLFQWQSQNRQHRAGPAEQQLARHRELGISIHLFVRGTAKVEGRAAPFLYGGECEFVDWEGDRPITVRWRLRNPVPERWWRSLGVPGEPRSDRRP